MDHVQVHRTKTQTNSCHNFSSSGIPFLPYRPSPSSSLCNRPITKCENWLNESSPEPRTQLRQSLAYHGCQLGIIGLNHLHDSVKDALIATGIEVQAVAQVLASLFVRALQKRPAVHHADAVVLFRHFHDFQAVLSRVVILTVARALPSGQFHFIDRRGCH